MSSWPALPKEPACLLYPSLTKIVTEQNWLLLIQTLNDPKLLSVRPLLAQTHLAKLFLQFVGLNNITVYFDLYDYINNKQSNGFESLVYRFVVLRKRILKGGSEAGLYQFPNHEENQVIDWSFTHSSFEEKTWSIKTLKGLWKVVTQQGNTVTDLLHSAIWYYTLVPQLKMESFWKVCPVTSISIKLQKDRSLDMKEQMRKMMILSIKVFTEFFKSGVGDRFLCLFYLIAIHAELVAEKLRTVWHPRPLRISNQFFPYDAFVVEDWNKMEMKPTEKAVVITQPLKMLSWEELKDNQKPFFDWKESALSTLEEPLEEGKKDIKVLEKETKEAKQQRIDSKTVAHLALIDVLSSIELAKSQMDTVNSKYLKTLKIIRWGASATASTDDQVVWVGPFDLLSAPQKQKLSRILFFTRKMKEWQVPVLEAKVFLDELDPNKAYLQHHHAEWSFKTDRILFAGTGKPLDSSQTFTKQKASTQVPQTVLRIHMAEYTLGVADTNWNSDMIAWHKDTAVSYFPILSGKLRSAGSYQIPANFQKSHFIFLSTSLSIPIEKVSELWFVLFGSSPYKRQWLSLPILQLYLQDLKSIRDVFCSPIVQKIKQDTELVHVNCMTKYF